MGEMAVNLRHTWPPNEVLIPESVLIPLYCEKSITPWLDQFKLMVRLGKGIAGGENIQGKIVLEEIVNTTSKECLEEKMVLSKCFALPNNNQLHFHVNIIFIMKEGH